MYGYIYLTTNLINGKKYIGKHKATEFDSTYFGSGQILKDAITKYGVSNFSCNILESDGIINTKCESLEELNNAEKYYIKKYKCVELDEYYNINIGGDGGFDGSHHSDQSKQKISAVAKDTVCITNGKVNKYIKKNNIELIDSFIQKGWWYGSKIKDSVQYTSHEERSKKLSAANSDRVLVVNPETKTVKKIKKAEINEYIAIGFVRGFVQNGIVILYVKITNGKKIKDILSNKVDEYLNKGWSKYPCDISQAEQKYNTYISDLRSKIMLKYHSSTSTEQKQATKDKIRKKRCVQQNLNLGVNKTKKLVTKQDCSTYIFEEDLPQYLAAGWLLGKCIAKKVQCIETNVIYTSASHAEYETNICHSNILACCKNTRQKAGGYHWRFVEEGADNGAN